MYASLGFTKLCDTSAAHYVPYVVVDACDVISLCVRALSTFAGSSSTVTSICRCLFACTHSLPHAQHAVTCGAMAPLKLIIRDGSLGSGAVAAAAAALYHVISNSGANVDREPMWQDSSLLEKLLFVVAGAVASAAAAAAAAASAAASAAAPVHHSNPTGRVANAAVDEVAWCSAVLALLARGSWMRTRLFVDPAALKEAVAVVCDMSMGKYSQCMTTAVYTMTLLANLFEGSKP